MLRECPEQFSFLLDCFLRMHKVRGSGFGVPVGEASDVTLSHECEWSCVVTNLTRW